MSLRQWIASAAVAAFAVPAFAAEPSKPLEPVAPSARTFGTLRATTPEAAKAKVEAWLKASGKLDRAKLDAVWAKTDATLLNRTVESIAIGKPEATKILEEARDAVATPPAEVPAAITGETDPFVKANLAAAYAKALAGKKVYETALKATSDITAEELVDPASYLFFKAVAEHALAGIEGVKGFATGRANAVVSIARLLDDVADAPDRYKMVATLMYFDMQNWAKDPKDLGNIAKMMDNSGRRLDLAQGGEATQEIQKKIVFRLDEKIKELENQCNGGCCSGGACPSGGSPGNPNGIQSSGPAGQSALPSASAPGKVDEKQLRKYAEVWGKLTPDARAKAVQDITKDLPPKHKAMIEDYFKAIDRMGGSGR